ncbi:MAG TPA: 2-keto-4-pentenoate hydratase [Allosphingosinicella sp.]
MSESDCVGVNVNDSAVIAGRFLEARRSAGGLDSYPGEFPLTLEQAYEIQDQAIAAWGQEVIGWKVGRVNPPYSEQFGTDRLAGPIFAQTELLDGEVPAMPVFAEGFAAGEAEYLLRVGRTPPAGQTSFTLEEAAGLIDAVHVGVEIASSPLASINQLGPAAVVSDFGNNNGLVVGPEIPDWRSSGFQDWIVALTIDGRQVGRGSASSFPDGAIGSARFLFQLMARRGIRLQPGQWISSGAVGGVHDAAVGQLIEARFGDAAVVRCKLVSAQPR